MVRERNDNKNYQTTLEERERDRKIRFRMPKHKKKKDVNTSSERVTQRKRWTDILNNRILRSYRAY